jgi:hypothetical protein
MRNASWENWLNLVLGAWLMIAPWVFPISMPVAGVRAAYVLSDSLAGAVLFGASVMALQQLTVSEEYVTLVAGLWTFFSPWILGFSNADVPFWTTLVVGAVAVLSSLFAIPAAREVEKRERGPGSRMEPPAA